MADEPLDIGDDAMLVWTYIPKATLVLTDAPDPTVEVWEPGTSLEDDPDETYTLADGVAKTATGTYRLYVPCTAAGRWVAYCSATGATKGRERKSWYVRAE